LTQKISIIGIGYVGLTLSLSLAKKNFKVLGYDKNRNLIFNLKKKKPPFYEKGLLRNLRNKNLFFSNKIEECLSDIYIITVGSPINKKKKPNLKYLYSIIRDISNIIKKDDLIILRSTIPFGFTRKHLIPYLEINTKLRCGIDFYLSMAPERTIEGAALKELSFNPQIIGGINDTSFIKTKKIFSKISKKIVKVPNIESAELCKLIDNSFRDNKFAFTNQFIPFAEKNGLNLELIIRACNFQYPRNSIAIPSPGVGGPCLTKDPFILREAFNEFNIKHYNFSNSREINSSISDYIVKKVKKSLTKKKNKKIFLVGMAFKGKPETSDLRESTSVDILKKLKKYYKIFIYDPVIKYQDLKKIHTNVVSIKEGFNKADAVLFLNNHFSYKKLKIFKLIKTAKKNCLLGDMWNIYNFVKKIKKNKINYWCLGNA
jgi:UDP-N-acetyl-D-mannosaminuronic acid dehydrogenase